MTKTRFGSRSQGWRRSRYRTIWDALSSDAEALESTVEHVAARPAIEAGQPAGATLTGRQRIAKFNKPAAEADEVLVRLALWRVTRAMGQPACLVLTVNAPLSGPDASAVDAHAREVFNQVVASLRVRDFGLFGPSS